jgi:hypothetical protein
MSWCGNFKSLSPEMGWVKSAENLGALPFKEDLSTDLSFSQIHRAGPLFSFLFSFFYLHYYIVLFQVIAT